MRWVFLGLLLICGTAWADIHGSTWYGATIYNEAAAGGATNRLLLETGDYLLLENNDFLELES